MFTGIVEEVGTIEKIIVEEKSLTLVIKGNRVLENINLGDSISTNGVCLTAKKLNNNSFEADVMNETIRRSNLGDLKVGSKVNLERALRLDSRVGGHIVTGHIDGLGKIISLNNEGNSTWVTIGTSNSILKYIVEKGSIAIDGISLTVAYVDDELFKVSIIPHTGEETILLRKRVGETVNLECDVIGKYVERLLGFKNKDVEKSKSNINENFLRENGFI